MTRFHIGKNGEPKVCNATSKPCPIGGEHYDTPDAAREAYEADMADQKVARGLTKRLNDRASAERKATELLRNAFFDSRNTSDFYTLVDTESGTVFSSNAVVMEMPVNVDPSEFPDSPNVDVDFNDTPGEFIDNLEYEEEKYLKMKPLWLARDLSEYKNPVIVETDTDLIVPANGKVYAIDTDNEIVDFEEILDSDAAAREAAETQGFKLWD